MMYKKIIIFSLVVSVLSLLTGVLSLISDKLFWFLDIFTTYDFPTLGGVSKINEMEHSLTTSLFFNSILFVSAVLFYKSHGKEARILRFFFSIIFVNKFLRALDNICLIYVVYENFGTFSFWNFLTLLLRICLLYFLYKSIKYMSEQKTVEYESLELPESEKVSRFKASKRQRLLHFIVDNLIFVIFPFSFLDLIRMMYFNGSFGIMEELLGKQNVVWAMLIIFQFVFYFAFETLFSATPGKFLTESRVVDANGLKAGNSFILKRTLSRYIPFDSVSFLFNANWHDSISQTQVYREKQTGRDGKLFFLLIPIYLILWLGIHLLGIREEKNDDYENSFKRFTDKKSELLEGLKTIDTNTILRLDDRNYDSPIRFLKIESISNNSIEFSVLDLKREGFGAYKLESYYTQSKKSLKRIKIKRNDLAKMVVNILEESPDYREGDRENFKGLSEISQLKGKSIEGVLQLNTPSLRVVNSNLSHDLKRDIIFVQLENRGVSGEVTSVTFDDKNIVFGEVLPEKFRSYHNISFTAIGKDIKSYKMKFIVNDSLKREFVYEISSTNDPTKVKLRLIK